MRLIGYARVSTEEQAREGVSLEAQANRIASWCKAMDAKCIAVEVDDGVSGGTEPSRRPGFAGVLEALVKGEADGLVVLKLDRLSRDVRHMLDLAELCQKRGWRLVSVSESLDSTTASGRLLLTILAAMAEWERAVISERTKIALAEIRQQGRASSRFTPFGWRTADGTCEVQAGDRRPLVPDRGEKLALDRIATLRAHGLGCRRIANRLTVEHIRNPRTGDWWKSRQVERALAGLEKA